MRKDWVEQTKDGRLTYCVSDDGGEMYLPVYWKDADDFWIDLNKATQIVFGMDYESPEKNAPKDPISNAEFFRVWFDIIKAKMRKESGHKWENS